MKDCQKEYDAPAHSLAEMKSRENKKKRGDIFEEFCRLYLLRVRNYTDVWLLDDLPAEVRAELQLPQRDMGIDIIAENNNNFYAIQCKYKNKKSATRCLSWKNLSQVLVFSQ